MFLLEEEDSDLSTENSNASEFSVCLLLFLMCDSGIELSATTPVPCRLSSAMLITMMDVDASSSRTNAPN